MADKKVLVSGCFDLLHCGHICFLEIAANYGDLYVSIGSDSTIANLKNRRPIYSEQERLCIIKSIRHVKHAFIASGNGQLDFIQEFKEIKPDVFIVNQDGHHNDKMELCKQHGVKYIVLDRTPEKLMPARSTTETIKNLDMPYRIDIAGGWLDQPWVSSFYPGPVITVSIQPTYPFPDRTGMATSTRNRAIKLWGNDVPFGNSEELSKILFCYDNCPGSQYVSGSQDAIGIVYPGINKLNYDGKYWPTNIESIVDTSVFDWLEENCRLIPLSPKSRDLYVLQDLNLQRSIITNFAKMSEKCWDALQEKNVKKFGRCVSQAFLNQVEIVPHSLTPALQEAMRYFSKLAYGMKSTGSGGFLFVVTPDHLENEIRIKVRRF